MAADGGVEPTEENQGQVEAGGAGVGVDAAQPSQGQAVTAGAGTEAAKENTGLSRRRK